MPKLRVWTLYRVSTKAQLTNDEIPTQKEECRKYILTQPNWELCREVSENGISAFKNKAIDRDVLNLLLSAAIGKEFDILLIYKGDRLGRLYMDTTFYLHGLFNNGVKTYSTVEHYLDVESHTSRLTTSLLFWLSEGESLSTSRRVSDFMKQYNEEGKDMGGTPPYGYKRIDTDAVHWKKKDKTIKKLTIDESEVDVIKLIFDLVYNSGFGGEKIANHLNSLGYKSRVGGHWRSNVINRILRNTIYIGYRRFNTLDKNNHLTDRGDVMLQPKDDSLIIIDESIFWKVQKLIASRLNRDESDTSKTQNPTSSKMLLSGIARCGYCGIKLKVDYSVKYHTKKDGSVSKYKVNRYVCNNAKDGGGSHEVKYFPSKRFETKVDEQIIGFIEKLDFGAFENDSKIFIKKEIDKLSKELNQVKSDLLKKSKELDSLKNEVTKVIMGESKFSSELLQELIIRKESEMKETNGKLKTMESKLLEAKLENSNVDKINIEYSNWIPKYKSATINVKKVMVSRLIKKLYFKKEDIDIDIALPFEVMKL